ncbi:class I SAM-dependent methyltransferase [Sulfurospirillum sp. T05]|uniref:Class I SAM-dependent methyltransferase n=1 Tax=Sulfurospirillum tamanense TaxID=2813362 RepID=A0ABS2WS30_9BACT|nr:class I SAM-dependent methyltransferase [Sulfurospirillum tamanensis]MBN2964459.1 class I SAM-dependent methyltransferase [Sulfurospirillum tamanensis]
MNLNKLIIKPTLQCTADCFGCVSRRSLHKEKRKLEQVTLWRWKEILEEAVALGCRNLEISGGEPTLYKNLLEIIELGKRLGLHVHMNTNGSMINDAYAEKLMESGLDSIMLSLYSHDANTLDSMRRSKGLWKKATATAAAINKARIRFPNFNFYTQTILCRENFKDFNHLIALHYSIGSDRMAISYLEGDFQKKFLLKKDEIKYFRETVIPKSISLVSELGIYNKREAVGALKMLYAEEISTLDDFSQGIYWKNKKCSVPSSSALILSNGDIHPCNIVEYAHKPIMGNIIKNNLTDLWNSDLWNQYRIHLHEKCELCPMNIHTSLGLNEFKFTRMTQEELDKLNILAGSLPSSSNIVEIGSYYGASSLAIAKGISLKENAILFCIDTWKNTSMSESDKDIYEEFLVNIDTHKHLIRPIRGYSHNVHNQIKHLAKSGIDMLFIDGDHSYEGVKRDWDLYSPMLKSGSVVIFHDVGWAEGVKKVIRENVKPVVFKESNFELPNMYWAWIK